MELSQKQSVSQTMRQDQTVSHQQIQALELLFLPVLELQAMIDEELRKNPVLEIDQPPDVASPSENSDSEEWLDKVLKLEESDRYIWTRTSTYSRDDEEKRKYYLESITSEPSFQNSLIDQLRFLNLDPELYSCCEVVISGLDDDNYLTSHPADLAMASGQSLELVNKAIEVVKKLEPAGVAAKDLRERLLLQLTKKKMEHLPIYTAVRDYLDEIASNHLPQVAKKMQVSLNQLKEIIREIQNLYPHISSEPVSPHEYIQEEVIVAEEGDELKVKINNEYLPSLYLSKQYKKLLEDPNTPKETRDYVKEKLRSGVFLINSIIQRQTTIRKIVNELVKVQKNFFKQGVTALKPLTMSQVAQEVGIHETTVSRAMAGKYLKCKYGLIPLRDFFSTGYETENGDSVSKNVIKNAIRTLINEEDAYSPLSDNQMVKELKQQGYKVARRTVAKYRESMSILPSNLRRQY